MCTFAFQTLNIIITAGWLAAGFYDPADAAPVDPPDLSTSSAPMHPRRTFFTGA
jgi:hypothetical protein